MDFSHAIVFVPVMLALLLCAALVSMALMQSPGGASLPDITGYVVQSSMQLQNITIPQLP